MQVESVNVFFGVEGFPVFVEEFAFGLFPFGGSFGPFGYGDRGLEGEFGFAVGALECVA